MTERVLFDTDPGCDDALMLAMAFGHPDVDVVGLTTVAGNTTVENTTANARAIASFAGAEIPVVRGAGRPLVSDLSTAEWVHGERGLRGRELLPDADGERGDRHAAAHIVAAAREYGADLTIAAVGPFTNFALALALEPDLPEMVGDIYVMGGATLTAGNVTPAAEANVHNDPEAASRVVQDCRANLVGLDVTMEATLPFDLPDYLDDTHPWKGVVSEWLDYPAEVNDFVEDSGYAVHDAAVAADLIGGVLDFEPYHVEVDTSQGPSRGSTICDYHGIGDEAANTDVAVAIDTEGFRECFLESMEGLR